MGLTIQEYLASLKGKKAAVLGIGVSNTPLIKMLLRSGVKVTACDKSSRERLGEVADELESLGAELCLGEGYLDRLKHDIIFRTPGMRPDLPQLIEAVERGAILTSEMEVFFEVCPCPIIAVTGSDGKTTTTTIIAKLLEAAGYNTYLGGNIGKPLLADAVGMEPGDMAVVELSSFQLMTMKRSPHIAVVTNLAPNHLDVHTSMSEYVAAKENIFRWQSEGDKVVLNQDNDITRGFASSVPAAKTMFSRRESLDPGVCVKNGAIWVNGTDGTRREVLPLADILLPGEHNIENYMAAIAAVDGLVPDAVIRSFAASFGGGEHIELVRELNGVKYYNDSIASSPSRTTAGLRSFGQKVILIAGGYDKHIPFEPLGPEIIDHVKELVLTGDTALKISSAVESAPGYEPGKPGIIIIDDFEQAVLTAHNLAQPGDIVLLSPACASFDKFKNFAQRGEAFKRIVHEL